MFCRLSPHPSEAIQILEERRNQAAQQADRDLLVSQLDAIYNDGFSYVGGNPDGDITLVEFLDYRCGFCKRAHPEVQEVLDRDPNVRLIVKEFPILGEQSLMASRFAIALKQVAGDAAYGQASDALMTMRADVTPESLTAIAQQPESSQLDIARLSALDKTVLVGLVDELESAGFVDIRFIPWRGRYELVSATRASA